MEQSLEAEGSMAGPRKAAKPGAPWKESRKKWGRRWVISPWG